MFPWITRKRLFAFHGWLGLTLGLPLFVVCFSGTFAVLSPEIDRMIHPEMRVTPPGDPEARPLSWQTLATRVAEASPGGQIDSLSASEDPKSAWVASVSYSPRDHRLVYFDPHTGEMLGQRTTFNAQSFFRIFHKQFYILEGPAWPHGRVIVCVFAIVLLLSAVTGLMFYKGWWKHLFRLRFTKGSRLLASDLHRFAGVWSLLLAILFAITGMWYLTERLMEDLGIREHDPAPMVAPEVLAARPDLVEPLPIDVLVERAREAYPGFEPTTIVFARRMGDAVTLYGHGTAALAENDRVHLDPHDGRVLEMNKAHGSGLGVRLESLVSPLHFGRFGGWVTKLVWTAAGLLISLGILAGAVIWWLRARKMTAGFFKRPPLWSVFSLVLNLAILVLAAFSTVAFIRAQVEGTRTTVPGDPLGRAEAGPWKIDVFGRGGKATIRFRNPEDPNLRAAYAWRGGEDLPETLEPLDGGTRTLHGGIAGSPDDPLRLAIESWNGTVHAAVVETADARGPVASVPPEPPEPPKVPRGLFVLVAGFFLATALPVLWWMAKVR